MAPTVFASIHIVKAKTSQGPAAVAGVAAGTRSTATRAAGRSLGSRHAHNVGHTMSIERVLFAFVIVLALTLNVGFVAGDIADIDHHNVYELYAAPIVSLIATVMKFGDRSALGSTMLATSLVADLQLIAAAVA